MNRLSKTVLKSNLLFKFFEIQYFMFGTNSYYIEDYQILFDFLSLYHTIIVINAVHFLPSIKIHRYVKLKTGPFGKFKSKFPSFQLQFLYVFQILWRQQKDLPFIYQLSQIHIQQTNILRKQHIEHIMNYTKYRNFI